MRTTHLLARLAALCVLAACDDAGVGPDATGRHRLLRVAGDFQSGLVGALLAEPLVVRVVDADGRGVPGAEVRWTVRLGAGSVAPDLATADADGFASTSWTLGPLTGVNSVEAVAGASPLLLFGGIGVADQPAALVAVSGDAQTGVASRLVAEPIAVRVLDARGFAVPDIVVRFRTETGTAGVLSDSARTDVHGVASTRWWLDVRPGANAAVAEAAGLAPVSFAATGALDGGLFLLHSLASGWNHSCGLGAAGLVWCWGLNPFGELGQPPELPLSGKPVSAGGAHFARVAAGYWHSCGLLVDGVAACWGRASAGSLGDGGDADRSTPAPIAGGRTFVQLSTDERGSCAVTSAGEVWCWGGTFPAAGSTPTRVAAPPAAAAAVGHYHQCVLAHDASVHCWGYLDADAGVFADAPVRVEGAPPFVAISAGNGHTCGLTASGEAWCWGVNAFGQLGDGTTVKRQQPARVAGDVALQSIAAGSFFTCGLALDGAAWCWGLNDRGQLGDARVANTNLPGPVAGGLAFSVLDVGSVHACAIATNGGTYCWGEGGARTGADRPRVRVPTLLLAPD